MVQKIFDRKKRHVFSFSINKISELKFFSRQIVEKNNPQ